MRLARVYAPISADLEAAKRELAADIRALRERYGKGKLDGFAFSPIEHLFAARGKSLRPALLLLAAGAARPQGYRRVEAARRAAGIVELIHSASLIHDDVIDESEHRRRIVSVHGKFGVKLAILAGDILFSHGFEVLATLPETSDSVKARLFELFADLTKRMCFGEMLELKHLGGTDSLEEYLSVIDLKTARLMSVSCLVGAILADGEEETTRLLGEFGYEFGMAYQLADDLIDRDSVFRGELDLRSLAKERMAKALASLESVGANRFTESLSSLCAFVFEQG